MQGLEKVVVSQALEICELREKLAEATELKDFWYGQYVQNEKPADAGTSTSE